MDPWLLDATRAALDRMLQHAELVGLPNTDEATFRSFFMASLRSALPRCTVETEWRRFDLLVRLDGGSTLVEFKYYILRRGTSLDGGPGQWKGGAGVQNEREFWDCVRKLHGCPLEPVRGRYLVLVYQVLDEGIKKKTYEASYGALAADRIVSGVATLSQGPLICKVLSVTPRGNATPRSGSMKRAT